MFGYDEGGRLSGEYSGTGVAQAEYIYLDSTPVGVVKGGVLYYIETDHLGTPRQVVKPTGNVVVWKWDFLQNTFGNSAPNQDPDGDSVQFVMGLRFPGQYYDAEAGLNYNYFRDYEPATGRYAEGDPLGLTVGTSVYAYGLSKPQQFFDSLGLFAKSCTEMQKDVEKYVFEHPTEELLSEWSMYHILPMHPKLGWGPEPNFKRLRVEPRPAINISWELWRRISETWRIQNVITTTIITTMGHYCEWTDSCGQHQSEYFEKQERTTLPPLVSDPQIITRQRWEYILTFVSF